MTPNEEWRPVVGYEQTHEVSSLGRVRRLARTVAHISTRRFLPCRMLTGTTSTSHYRNVTLSVDGKDRLVAVHRLVAEAFLGPRPPGMETCHANGDRFDNRIANLRYDTSSANKYDQVRHGTHANASKTHCKRGHEFTPDNTHIEGGKYRRCKTCRAAKMRRFKQREREGRFAT